MTRWRSGPDPTPSAPEIPPVDLSAGGLDFDDVALESQLTWIWGSPRSGSTWLLQLLAHPLDPDPETALGFRPPKGATPTPYDTVPIDETFISNHLSPALGDPVDVDGTWVAGTLHNYLSGKPAYVYSDEYAHVWRPEVRRMALVRINSVLDRARAEGVPLTLDPRVVIKETNGSHASDLVMSIVPRSRLLLLIRDGRDVVDSLVAAYQPGAFLANNQRQSFGTPELRAERLLWAARLWACNTDTTLKAIDSHPTELVRIVRYEDLLADTAGQLASLYSWLGLERDRSWIEGAASQRSFSRLPEDQKGPLTRNRAAKPGLWRENLSAGEQEILAETFGGRLQRFGYAD